MRVLFFALLASFCGYGVVEAIDWHASQTDVTRLSSLIKTQLPDGWNVTYDRRESTIHIKRDRAVMGMEMTPQGPPEMPASHEFEYRFIVVPFIPLSVFKKLRDENVATQKQIDAITEQLGRSPTARVIIGDVFESSNPDDKKKIAERGILAGKLHILPDYHAENLGLIAEPQWIQASDETVARECEDVFKKIVAPLDKY